MILEKFEHFEKIDPDLMAAEAMMPKMKALVAKFLDHIDKNISEINVRKEFKKVVEEAFDIIDSSEIQSENIKNILKKSVVAGMIKGVKNYLGDTEFDYQRFMRILRVPQNIQDMVVSELG